MSCVVDYTSTMHDSIQWLSRCPKCTGIAKDSSQGPHNVLWGERHPIYVLPPQFSLQAPMTLSPPQGHHLGWFCHHDPPLCRHHHLHIHNHCDYCPERVHFICVLHVLPLCLLPSPAFLLFQVDYCNSPLRFLCTCLFIFMTFIMRLDKIPSIFPFLLTALMFYFKYGHSFLSKFTDCDISSSSLYLLISLSHLLVLIQ